MGDAFFQELVWVHDMIRRDLATVQELAARVADGLPAGAVAAELRELEANGPLWQLKVNCLHYCEFVHSHHRVEDAALFPLLRQAEPKLGPVVDRLEGDHRRVAELLEEVEAATAALAERDSPDGRARVAGALDALAEHLLEHLQFEETSLEEPLGRLRHPLAS